MAEQKGKDRYPTLRGMLDELKVLEEAGSLSPGGEAGGEVIRLPGGAELRRFQWPGSGDYWLTAEQHRIASLLREAFFESRNPDLKQATLLRGIGKRDGRLADVFDGSDAWGTLIVRGDGPGTYRLATPTGPTEESTDD